MRRISVSVFALLMASLGAVHLQGQQGQPPPGIAFRNDRADAILELQRPLRGNERAQFQAQGLRIYEAVGPNRFLVRVNRRTLEALQRNPQFSRLTPVGLERKVSATLRAGNPAQHARLESGRIQVRVRFYPDVEFDHALTLLRRHGLEPEAGVTAFSRGSQINAQATAAQVLALADTPYVRWIQEVAPPAKLHNATAAQLSRVDLVQAAPYNLRGTAVNVGIWDGGPIRTSHQDLGPRFQQVEGGSDDFANQDHGTHVAGTIASSGLNNPTARGMAPGARVFAWRFRDNSPVDEQDDAFWNQGIRVSNHSWGPVLGWDFDSGTNMWTQTGGNELFGAYEGDAVDWDQLVRDRSTLTVVKSAGNDDGDCGSPGDCDGFDFGGQSYDLIGTFGNAKNIITVGAINDDGTTKAGFSGTGPADDSRIKPDVVANGVSLTSTCADSDSDYCSKSGTSMSSPVVTGTVALMIQHYQDRYGVTAAPSAAIMKALLANTAEDLGRPGPDYQFGFGRVDALRAAQTIDAGPVRILTGSVDEGDTDEYLLPVPAGTPQLRVTLNWIDPPGSPSTSDNDNDPDLVNDLDLVLVAPDNSLRYPFSGPGRGNPTGNASNIAPNFRDTLEQAVVANPQQGFWKARVRGRSVPDGPQNYALVSNVSFSLPGQPEIEVNAPLDFNQLCVGQREDRTVSIFNTGGGVLQISSIVLAGSPTFTILSGPTAPFLILPGAHVELTIRFAPTQQSMADGATLTILSNDADEGSVVIALSGSSGAPQIDTLIASNGQFGNVCRESFKDLTLTIVNSGSCTLSVSNITSNSADFKVASTVSYPVSVGPGDSLQVPIRYQSADLGSDTGTITVTSNAATRTVSVSGTTPPGDLQVSGSTAFGNVCSAGAEKQVNLCNLGLCNVNVASVALESPSGGACNDFVIVNNPFAAPAPISKDFCAPITVRFTPSSVGAKQCTLRIVTDDPDTPVVTLPVTGTLPAPQLSVPASISYLPEVIQSVGACTTSKAWPVANTGACPVEVTAATVSTLASDYSLAGLPSTPISVKPGQQLGQGDLRSSFGPTELARQRAGVLSVTWKTDPILGTTTTSNTAVCGEGVRTGARVLVTINGAPAPTGTVEKLQLARMSGNKNSQIVDTVSVAKDLPLVTVPASGACGGFQYHREYGTVANPSMLMPGSYRVTVTAVVNGKRQNKTVAFDVSTCDFNPTVVVDF